MSENFKMIAKTFYGFEDVLAMLVFTEIRGFYTNQIYVFELLLEY